MSLGGHAGSLFLFPAPPDLLAGYYEASINVNAPPAKSGLQADQGVWGSS